METSQRLGTWQQSSDPSRRGRPPGPPCRACSTPPSASSLVRPSRPPKPSWSGQLLATASLKIGKSNCRWSGEAIVAEHPGLARRRRDDFILERPADRRVMQSKSPRDSFNLEPFDENQPPNLGPELVSHHRCPDAAKPINCLAFRSEGTSLRKLSLR